MSLGSDTEILARIVDRLGGTLPRELAPLVLQLDFAPEDHDRVATLSEKAREGTLTPTEREELDSYLRINDLLGILKSDARRALNQTGS